MLKRAKSLLLNMDKREFLRSMEMIKNMIFLIELFAYLYCLAKLFGRKLQISIHIVILIILDLFLLTGIGEYGITIVYGIIYIWFIILWRKY